MTMTTMTGFDLRRMRIFFAPDDGGGTGGAGGGGESGGAGASGDSGQGGDFDAAAAAQAAVAANQPTDVPKIEWDKVAPADLKDKPWFQEIMKDPDPTKRLFNDLAGLQSKLGQRVEGIPKADAPKEEWDKFYNALGRPEAADKYEVPKTEWPEGLKEIGEFIEATGGDGGAYAKVVKEVAYELGVSQEKFQAAWNKLNIGFAEANKELFVQAMNGKNEADFDYATKMTQKFGQDAEKVQGIASKILEMTADEDAKKAAANMSNEELVRLALVLNGVQKKFISEDVFTKEGASGSVKSEQERRTEGMKLMAHPAYEDFTHPEHEAIYDKVQDLYGRPRKYAK